ncbi:hypothetical protein ACRALDRAFT_1078837 [Sodiomyces alcalophilus JCM 7366]|uniref:uncharacterized protein n=1 Tax=Sodiomyces alcalophilus JCM 7366 TaxID=591952 RepID=UPI0039B47ECB
MTSQASRDVDIENVVGSVVDSLVSDAATSANADLGIPPSQSFSDEEIDDAPEHAAPIYPIAKRIIGAVEVPMIVMNLDRAEKAFGNLTTFQNVLDLERLSIPFYLNPESPFRRPILSHQAATHNIVLKVTVPKRTGRRRKKGSNGPFEGEEVEAPNVYAPAPASTAAPPQRDHNVCSRSRLDNPRVLRRKLQDNVDTYRVEAVGVAKGTHRFRSLADYQWDMDQSPFMTRFMDQVMSGDIKKMREFKFREGTDFGPNVDLIPPPAWTPTVSLPFNYGYAQNPYVRPELDHTGKETLVNTQMPTLVGYFLSADQYPIPEGPQLEYDGDDEDMKACIATARKLMEERPIWTRRSLLNALGDRVRNAHIMKRCTGFVGYQFRGGPFRDALIKYGFDPRSDPSCRIYQTLLFNLRKLRPGYAGETWHGLRSMRADQRQPMGDNFMSHIFDGKSFWTDSKIWQICDITDSVVVRIVEQAPVRPTCDVLGSGWFHTTTWAKLKAVMKTKMMAIQFGRKLTDEDFAEIIQVRDKTPEPGAGATRLPVPDLKLTEDEMRVMYGKNWKVPKKKKKGGFDYRVKGVKAESVAAASTEDANGSMEGGSTETAQKSNPNRYRPVQADLRPLDGGDGGREGGQQSSGPQFVVGSEKAGLERIDEQLSETDDDEAVDEEEADILAQISGLRGPEIAAGSFGGQSGQPRAGGGKGLSVAGVAGADYGEYDDEEGDEAGYYDEEGVDERGNGEEGYRDEYRGYYEEEEYDEGGDAKMRS